MVLKVWRRQERKCQTFFSGLKKNGGVLETKKMGDREVLIPAEIRRRDLCPGRLVSEPASFEGARPSTASTEWKTWFATRA
jgi:hypothetical protein